MTAVGDKVRVIDRRDGTVIMRGELTVIDGDFAIVRGRYCAGAFPKGFFGENDAATIKVPRRTVEPDDNPTKVTADGLMKSAYEALLKDGFTPAAAIAQMRDLLDEMKEGA